MYLKAEELIKLDNGPLLEVLFADEEKAVCIKLHPLHTEVNDSWFRTDSVIVVSNKEEDYMDVCWLEKLPNHGPIYPIHWEPMRMIPTYNLLSLPDTNTQLGLTSRKEIEVLYGR